MSETSNPASRYVIIGNGVAGTTTAETIRKADADAVITILADEPYPLYNRIALPRVLQRPPSPSGRSSARWPGTPSSASICAWRRPSPAWTPTAGWSSPPQTDTACPYDSLLIATGGRPNPLPAPGARLKGIYNFQYWDDAEAIRERMNSAKHSVASAAATSPTS